jgi:hypothetical protein
VTADVLTTTPRGQLQLARPPATKDELWWVVYAMFNVALPRVAICEGHVAPFDAFCEGYFGNDANWVLWYGSRGTGKSYMLALLALVKAAVLEINVTLLGGSMAQSQNVQEHVENLMMAPGAPTQAVTKQIQTELEFGEANWIRPLPASQKTVRGPHPHMTLLDEIDEMDKAVYDAAMGQAMEKPNARGIMVPEMVVASSTWQNPVGTFQEVRDDALKKGMPVRTWCWREVIKSERNPTGWMKPEFIERKRLSVPAEMFRVEYELGEPAGGSRAFDLEKLNKYFIPMEAVDERHVGDDEEWTFEQYNPMGTYAAGADWAKEKDKTVFCVVRTDGPVRRLVYTRIWNRRPWPMMIDAFNDLCTKYQAVSAHDATGLGNVIHDMIDERTMKVVMIGRDRTILLSDYVTAVEQGEYLLPRNTPLFNAHKATTVEEVFGTGNWKSHLADEVAAMAICHRAAERMAPAAAAQGVPKTETPKKDFEQFHAKPDVDVAYDIGGVSVRMAPDDIAVFNL